MRTKKARVLALCLSLSMLAIPRPARADFWGGDIPLLIEIVANTLKQLAELRALLNNGRDQLDLIREINRGINDSMSMIRTTFPNLDPAIYRDWDRVQTAAQGIEQIYGAVPKSTETRPQQDTDTTVAEAISLNNQIFKYTKDIDEIGEQIKQYSHVVSPGGAQKLTAQSMGVMLTVMNQSLRTQATGLKLQAQALATENRREKESTRYFQKSMGELSGAMRSMEPSFQVPRF